MRASLATDAAALAPAGPAPADFEAQPAAAGAATGFALASFFAPAPQAHPQVLALAQEQALEHAAAQAQAADPIAGAFVAPAKTPLPPARPDFGDRLQLASAETAPPAQAAQPEPMQQTAAAAPGAVLVNAPPPPAIAPQTLARAELASLGAYEFKSAGVPLPAGGLRATNISFTPAEFEIAGAPGVRTGASAGGQRWRAAYDSVETDCFPDKLRRALDKLAAHFNSEVLVTSGMRDRGRRGSMHRSCKAADIRVAGVSPGEVARVARTIPGVNGVGTYRRVAVTHVDVREESFAWRW